MSIVKYAKVLLQSPGTGSVLICFISLSLGVALIAEWGRSSSHPSRATAKDVTLPRTQPTPAAIPFAAPSGSAQTLVAIHRTLERPVHTPAQRPLQRSAQHRVPKIFQESIATDQLGFLTDYAGRPASEALREQRVRQLMTAIVPYAPFHLGLDMPLPTAIANVLSQSEWPIEIRNGRYMMVSTPADHPGPRGFLWIDIQQGVALGGIYFHPTNGEPTPTLTLFSRQVNQGALEMKQLPAAFAQDLARWTVMTGIPPITTRYFINASSRKTVLSHDEDFCKLPQAASVPTNQPCQQLNAQATEIDTQAVAFLDHAHYASNATLRSTSDPLPTSNMRSRPDREPSPSAEIYRSGPVLR